MILIFYLKKLFKSCINLLFNMILYFFIFNNLNFNFIISKSYITIFSLYYIDKFIKKIKFIINYKFDISLIIYNLS